MKNKETKLTGCLIFLKWGNNWDANHSKSDKGQDAFFSGPSSIYNGTLWEEELVELRPEHSLKSLGSLKFCRPLLLLIFSLK